MAKEVEKKEAPKVSPEAELEEKARLLWEEKKMRVNTQLIELLRREKVRLVPIVVMRVDDLTGARIDVKYDLAPDAPRQ